MQQLCCIPSRWCFHSMKLRVCRFGEPCCAACGGPRQPGGCKTCWDNAGEPWNEPELALDCPYCLLGMPAIPQAMPGIPWEGTYGHRPQLYDKRLADLAGCTINSPELEFDSALELNTPDTSSVYISLHRSGRLWVPPHVHVVWCTSYFLCCGFGLFSSHVVFLLVA